MSTDGCSPVILAAYILTLDEQTNVEGAVRSAKQLTDAVLVLDSGSTDSTTDIATAAGATVLTRPFDSYDRQRNYAVECVVNQWDPEWVLTIDADERLSPELIDEIRRRILATRPPDCVDAYLLPRTLSFEGRILRFGGFSKTRLVRIFRPAAGRYEERPVNEHFALFPRASYGSMNAPIMHLDVDDWERHIAKHNRYSTLEAIERSRQQSDSAPSVTLAQAWQARYLRRRWIREQIWNRLPAKPFLRFVQTYVCAGGFRDGRPGFDIALVQAWQELCIERKYDEIARRAAP